MLCFGARNDPEIGLRGRYSTHIKSSSSWQVIQDWCDTRGKLPKIGVVTYFGVQWGTKIGPLRPIFSTHLKVYAMSMWRITDVKPVKTFRENDQSNFDYFRAQMAPTLGLGAYIPYTTEGTCNEDVKQCWCETSENYLRKWPRSAILNYFGVQNGPKHGPLRRILFTSLKVAPMSI